MLTRLSQQSSDSLLLELGDQTAGIIGGYCEDGFPIYYANTKMAQILGYGGVDELIEGIDGLVANTIHPDDMERVVRELNNGEFYEGMTYKVTYRMPRKDGSWIWTVDRGKVITAEDGRLAILSVCNDMTEFIDEHTELEHEYQLSRMTLENMPGGYHRCACDDDFTFLYISEKFLEIFGWTREEIATEFDNKFMNMLHPEDRATTVEYTERLKRYTGTSHIADTIYRMRGKNGYIWVSDATSLVQTSDSTFYQGTLTNISDFVVGQQLQYQIINALGSEYNTLYLVDSATKKWSIIKINEEASIQKQFQESFQFENYEEALQSYIAGHVTEPYQQDMREYIKLENILANTPDDGINSFNYDRDMNGVIEHWQLNTARFIAADGNAYIVIGFRDVNDIIEKQLREEEALREALAVARHATRAKSVFLSNMSHDIRTPMNAIIGYTALAQTHLDNHEQVKDYLSKIHTSGTHLLSLINEILDMSRIESGTVKLEENVVHLPDVLHDLRSMIQGQVAAKQQHLYIDALDVVNEDVITDKLRLNQVLLNIVSNAIKYTDVGGNIIIRVTEKPCSIKDYTAFEFSVKDTGKGMSPEFVEHVFDSFSRERTSTVSGIQGTGLGMSITKSIVDLMNGDITVHSELGVGSEFIVNVNFKLAASVVTYMPIEELQGARALVVDDDIDTCQSVGKMLREIGMRPDWSTSGREAIVRAREATKFCEEYKAYIIDYLMPDMNGIETVRQIRRVISEEVPIIVLTAYDWSDFEAEARDAGVTAFVAKPIFMSELRKVLTRGSEQPLAAEEEAVKYDYSGKRVLLVEDNELNAEIATALLEETGIIVDTVTDGSEAVDVIYKSDENTYDLIFMDIQMPRMDGYTATREIRTFKNNRKANIPIVAMTANAFEEDKKKAIEAGMNDHISKPIDMAEIARVLDIIYMRKNV